MEIFKTTILGVGPDAEDFKTEKMIILFGEDAPEELFDFCHIIQLGKTVESIQPGMILLLKDTPFKISAVGEVAENNLNELGHLGIMFTGSTEAEMPGSIYVEDKEIPLLQIGDSISIIKTN